MNTMNWVGQTLGQYRIEAPLDAGGMGQVFRGVHIYLNRPAAIKVMRPHLAANAKFRTRFLQEAQAAAALKHPNIVDLYEFGEQDDHLYMVMELITGGSLRTLLQQQSGQPRPLTLGLDLIRQAAEGLAAAHAKGIIHRDIKPDNLLLNRLNDSEERFQVKITDFGIARLIEGGSLTATGALPIGTVTYMSPEQCRSEQVDGRSDLYALGIVLYEVLTGYLPFKIDNFNDGIFKHINAEPPSPRLLRPDLPPHVEEIIQHCLAKKPAERFQSCAALARVLRDLQDEEPITMMTMPLLPLPKPSEQASRSERTPSTLYEMSETPTLSFHIPTLSPDAPTFIKGGETMNPTIIKASEPSSIADMSRQTPGIYQTVPSGESQRIGLFADSKTLMITPGQATRTQVTITNLGQTVDWFTLTVEGVPASWLQLPDEEVQLNPGMQETVELYINVARVPNNLAQEYPVTVRARSREKPTEAGATSMCWTVQPFKEEALHIEPRRVSGRGRATYAVTLQNSGNTLTQYELKGDDDEQKLAYQFGANQINLEPGQETRVRLAIRTRRHLLGGAVRLPFQVHARSADSSTPLSTPGEFVNKALLPLWLLPVALIVIATAVGLASVFGLLPFPPHSSPPPATITPTTAVTPTAGPTATPTVGPTATSIPIPPLNWTPQTSGTSSALYSITWSGTRFVAVGGNGTILTSPDGTNWAARKAGITNDLFGVTWAKSQSFAQFVAVGDTGTILTSPDGINWTQQTSITSYNLNGIIWTGSQFVAVGNVGTILTSPDGTNWTRQASGITDKLGNVAQNTSLLVAVGGPSGGANSGGVILTSPLNGTNWTLRQVNTTKFLRSIAWSGSRFIAVGNEGTIFTSSDGINNWTQDNTSNISENLGAINCSGPQSQCVIVGDTGSIFSSAGGINWTRHDSVTPNYLRNIIWAKNRYIAVGAGGTILTSG